MADDEPYGALTLDEMRELVTNKPGPPESDTGRIYYYVMGFYKDCEIHSGHHSNLAFLSTVRYFTNYFHALAFVHRCKENKVAPYRHDKPPIIEAYPIITAKTKRR